MGKRRGVAEGASRSQGAGSCWGEPVRERTRGPRWRLTKDEEGVLTRRGADPPSIRTLAVSEPMGHGQSTHVPRWECLNKERRSVRAGEPTTKKKNPRQDPMRDPTTQKRRHKKARLWGLVRDPWIEDQEGQYLRWYLGSKTFQRQRGKLARAVLARAYLARRRETVKSTKVTDQTRIQHDLCCS